MTLTPLPCHIRRQDTPRPGNRTWLRPPPSVQSRSLPRDAWSLLIEARHYGRCARAARSTAMVDDIEEVARRRSARAIFGVGFATVAGRPSTPRGGRDGDPRRAAGATRLPAASRPGT